MNTRTVMLNRHYRPVLEGTEAQTPAPSDPVAAAVSDALQGPPVRQ